MYRAAFPLRNASVDTILLLLGDGAHARTLARLARIPQNTSTGREISSYQSHSSIICMACPKTISASRNSAWRCLAAAAGLEVIEITTSGGLAHGVFQALSMLWTACLWTPRKPTLAQIPAHGLAFLARALDRIDARGVFRQNVNAVLRTNRVTAAHPC